MALRAMDRFRELEMLAAMETAARPSVLDTNRSGRPSHDRGGASPINPKIILSTLGVEIICDEEDYERLSQHKWHITRHGYATTKRSSGGTISMHRMLLQAGPGQEVDHANRVKLDNRKSNLRFCSRSQNIANTKSKPNKLGYRGVQVNFGPRYRTPRYRAAVVVNQKQIRGGSFDTPEQAARDYDRLALIHFGQFAILNFPQEVCHVD